MSVEIDMHSGLDYSLNSGVCEFPTVLWFLA